MALPAAMILVYKPLAQQYLLPMQQKRIAQAPSNACRSGYCSPPTLRGVLAILMVSKRYISLDTSPPLCPLFPELFQSRRSEILRPHHRVHLNRRIEQEKPGLRDRRDLGRILQIHY